MSVLGPETTAPVARAAPAPRNSSADAAPAAWLPRDKRDRWILAAILLGALLLRLAVLSMPGEQMFENGLPAFEELQRGNATYDILRGPLLPLLEYQLNHFSGGSLVMSILAIPSFWLFGPTFQAMRLTSLLFSVPLVLVVFLAAHRWSGKRAAIVASSLVAFAPPGFTFLSCTVYGTHPEGNFIAVLLVCLFLAWREAGREGLLRSLLLGMLIGFSLYFTYGLIVIVSVLLACDFAATGMRRVRKADWMLGAGFLIGFSPWVLYMARHPTQAFHIYGSSITDHVTMGVSRGDNWRKLWDVAMRDGPNGFWMHSIWPGIGGLVARCLFFTLALVVVYGTWSARHEILAFLRALAGRRRGFVPSLRLVAVLFVFAWSTAFTLTDFQIDTYTWVQGYRYLLPFYPFVALLFGMAVEDFVRRGRRLGPSLFVAGLCCANVGFTVQQLHPELLTDPVLRQEHWSRSGIDGKWYLRMLVNRFGDDPETLIGVLRRSIAARTELEQAALADGLARGVAMMATKPVDDRWPEPRRRKYEVCLGRLAADAPDRFRPVFETYLAQTRSQLAPH